MGKPSPRLRQDLVVSNIEDEGVSYADVSDPQTGTKFRFYDFEYQLALQLNGQSVDDVVGWAASAYGAELTVEGIDEFAGRLSELGFLEAAKADPGAGPGAAPSEITDQGSAPLESAEAEWMSPQGAQTAQFTPDFAMLTSPDRTPVAPELPILEALERAAERTPGPREIALPAAAPPVVAPPVAAAPAPVPARTSEAITTPIPEPTPIPTPAPPPAPVAAPIPSPPVPALPSAALMAPPVPSVPAAPVPQVSVAVTRPREAPTVRLPPEARSIAFTRPADAPTIPSLPSAIETGLAVTKPSDITPPPNPPAAPSSPTTPTTAPKQTPGGGSPKWAMDLDGALDGGPGEATPPPRSNDAPPGAALAPAHLGAPARATAAPAGATERRQPPTPDLVSMTPFSDDKQAKAGADRRPMIIAGVLLAVLAIAVIGFLAWRGSAKTPQALRVRVFSPKPAAVYRWFTGQGVVAEDAPRTLAFDSPGRVVELWPPGTEFGTSDVVGRLHSAAGIETLLAHHRSRLAFYEQMRDSMRSAGNAPETRQAEIKLADKQKLVDDTNAGLARVVLRPTEPGEVLEVLTRVGAQVRAGTPVVRVKGRLLHGEFELTRLEMESTGELGLCRVEVVGLGPRASNADPRRTTEVVSDSGSPEAQNVPRFIDCQTANRATGSGGRLTVALPNDVGLVPGQPLRLARHRFDAVFPVPADTITRDGGRRSVFIATASGVAEKRDVVVAEAGEEGEDALISAGLRVGDQVMLEAPPDLKPGAPIIPERW